MTFKSFPTPATFPPLKYGKAYEGASAFSPTRPFVGTPIKARSCQVRARRLSGVGMNLERPAAWAAINVDANRFVLFWCEVQYAILLWMATHLTGSCVAFAQHICQGRQRK